MKILKFVSLVILVSCASHIKSSIPRTKLRFIGDRNIPTGTSFHKTQIGGLSGIVYDTSSKTLLAVSDDRSNINPARLYNLKISINYDSFDIFPQKVVILKKRNNNSFAKGTVDFEGITTLSNGNLLITSEGDGRRIPPSIVEFEKNGLLAKKWSVPDHFIPQKSKLSIGTRRNLAFESLTITPDKNHIFTATEQALYQDDTISSIHKGSYTRIIYYKKNQENFHPGKEYVYQIDPIPNPTNLTSVDGDNGLVDLVAFSKDHFLALERSWNASIKKNFIKIYEVIIDSKATDVSKMVSLKNNKWTPLKKRLVLNLEEIIPHMSKDNQRLDNVEGICFGPRLQNGNQTLILVSDNNFSPYQRTLFMAFEIIP